MNKTNTSKKKEEIHEAIEKLVYAQSDVENLCKKDVEYYIKKTHRCTVRMSPAEKDIFQMVGDLTETDLSTMLRLGVPHLGAKIPKEYKNGTDYEMLKTIRKNKVELVKIGTNINQISKVMQNRLNTINFNYCQHQIKRMQDEVKDAFEDIKEIRRLLEQNFNKDS